MPAEDWWCAYPSGGVFLSSLHSLQALARAAPTVCTMILKGGGVGRGWSQVSWTSKSSLGSRKSRYVPFECVCAPVWESVSQCERGLPLWDGVSHCGKVCGMCVCLCMCVCVLPRVLTVAELMINIAFPISTS